jgi:hypothetical protein
MTVIGLFFAVATVFDRRRLFRNSEQSGPVIGVFVL